jgi:pimeloyl-ACP methyl ester carboxylesterase
VTDDDRHRIELPGGVIEYRDTGTGPPLVFVHGLLVNGALWRAVVPHLQGYRCLVGEWPLGSHRVQAGGDLTPRGIARLIAEFLHELDLEDVTLVANDTGGALVQILMAEWPERIGRVVLTPCDAFEAFFPPPYHHLPKVVRIPGATWLASRLLQRTWVQQRPSAYGWLTRRPIPPAVMREHLRPIRESRKIRREARRFIASVSSSYTQEAARKLQHFPKPVLLVRAADDQVFPAELFDRLAAILPDARIVTVANSRTYVPEDQPVELARLIVDFTSEPRSAGC